MLSTNVLTGKVREGEGRGEGEGEKERKRGGERIGRERGEEGERRGGVGYSNSTKALYFVHKFRWSVISWDITLELMLKYLPLLCLAKAMGPFG